MHRQLFTGILFIGIFRMIHSGYCQNIIVDPASAALQPIESSNFCETLLPVHLSVNVQSWEVTCIAEAFIDEINGSQIPNEQLYIKHNFVDEFQMLNTSVDLGTGSSGEIPFEINTLHFRFIPNGAELAGNYRAVVRFFDFSVPVAQLDLFLTIQQDLQFEASNTPVQFYASMPDLYPGDRLVDVTIAGNTDAWHLEAFIEPASDTRYFSGENVFIRSLLSGFTGDEGAGPGFQKLEGHPVLITGDEVGQGASTQIEFKILTDWRIPKGNHHIIVELKIPESGQSHYIDLTIQVLEYIMMSLSESSVYFHANGPPQVWNGDKSSMLTVGSNNENWGVIAQATNLVSPDDEIPNARLFMKIDPDDFTGDYGAGVGYHKLDAQLEVAVGTTTPPKEICELFFRLQTLDIDRPGHYEGVITFTYLSNP